MAQEIADSVFGKLCQAAFEEVVALYKVGDKLELAKRELTRIQCFLKEADDRADRDARVKNWVEEMRGVSVLIQEAMEMYLAEVAEPSLWRKITGKHLAAKRKLGRKIDTILERIEEITQSKEKYGIENLGKRRMTESAVRVGPNRYIIPDLDELEIVGFVADKEKIIAQLLDENILKRSVVSIVGTGGLGKTTLAQKVYSSDAVKSRFKIRVWLYISQEFSLIALLKKMLETLRTINKNEETRGEEYFIGELNQSLRNQKYLIVMDDVWSNCVWSKFVTVLPDVVNGSRVLMTSRFSKIAKAADHTFEPYELPLLSKEESLQLLLKTALPNRKCPTYLLDIAEQLADNCEGLPLALVVLGGLLKTKSQTHTVWGKFLKTKVWDTIDGKECMDIISTSYDDMPSDLKTCFMYLASFPEDFEIDARNLIRLWVAEGFIPQHPGETLEEDTTNEYLEQLAERYMVMVVRRGYDDSICAIRIHDVLHDLAIGKAKERNFITVLLNKDVNWSPSTVSSRVTLQSSRVDQLMEHAGPSLHSLHYYFSSKELPDCSKYEELRVCNIETSDREGGEIRLERPNHLRFLRTRNSGLVLNLPAGQLRNIQTLDLRGVYNKDREIFFKFIWGIETLRHVLLSYPISGPPSSAKLQNLQTLGYVKESDSWTTQLPDLTNVRCLKLSHQTSLKAIASLLETLKNLMSLTLETYRDTFLEDYKQIKSESNKIVVVGEESVSDEERAESGGFFDNEYRDFIFNETNKIVNMQVFPFYNDLQKLHLSGPWVDCLDRPGVILPLHLVKLHLRYTGLLKDPMPALEKLECLKILILGSESYVGKKMICSTGGFPCLEQLKLDCLRDLVELRIEEGAMPSLKILNIQLCGKLKRLAREQGTMPSLKQLLLTRSIHYRAHVESLPLHFTGRIEPILPESAEDEESD